MIKKTFAILLLIVLVIVGFKVFPENTNDDYLSTNPAGEITSVENFSLKDVDGKTHSLSDYSKSKAIVIMFIATECPVSNAYNKRMAKLYEDYKEKNITILGINSNKAESISDIKAHSTKNKFGFPVLKDEKNIIADKFAASFTPEIYILDPALNIVYHGRIDDSRNETNVTSKDLSRALDEIIQGIKVSVAKTKAFGCTIKRV